MERGWNGIASDLQTPQREAQEGSRGRRVCREKKGKVIQGCTGHSLAEAEGKDQLALTCLHALRHIAKPKHHHLRLTSHIKHGKPAKVCIRRRPIRPYSSKQHTTPMPNALERKARRYRKKERKKKRRRSPCQYSFSMLLTIHLFCSVVALEALLFCLAENVSTLLLWSRYET